MYDFELCDGIDALKRTIEEINRNGYAIVDVTQSKEVYTVIFKRFGRIDR